MVDPFSPLRAYFPLFQGPLFLAVPIVAGTYSYRPLYALYLFRRWPDGQPTLFLTSPTASLTTPKPRLLDVLRFPTLFTLQRLACSGYLFRTLLLIRSFFTDISTNTFVLHNSICSTCHVPPTKILTFRGDPLLPSLALTLFCRRHAASRCAIFDLYHDSVLFRSARTCFRFDRINTTP